MIPLMQIFSKKIKNEHNRRKFSKIECGAKAKTEKISLGAVKK
jgi:hypothetical protein